MIARDGFGLVFGTIAVFLVALALWYQFPGDLLLGVVLVLGALSLFNLFFFRDPNRNIPKNPFAVLSPADGTVSEIVKEKEEEYFQKQVQRISIFLSVFNVHVNRSPLAGRVDYFAYRTGKFLAAFKPEASADNEQTVIGMVDERGHKILFKQIAGLIARRIVCNLREGKTVAAGQRIGLIRYGSRMDIFLPMDAKVLVKKGQRVKAGETVLATFPDQGDRSSADRKDVELPQSEITG